MRKPDLHQHLRTASAALFLVTAAAAEVQASNVLTDAPAKVIVDKWPIDQAIDWADKKIKEIYETLA